MQAEALKGRPHVKSCRLTVGTLFSLLLPVLHICTIISHRWTPMQAKALKGRARKKIAD
jgi:hypothetical protein